MEPNLALIGCGYWGKNLVRNFYQLGALRMVCDESRECRVNASNLAPDCEIVCSTNDVFSSSVDAVVIATPAVTHFALVREALERGKDVFVEKPLALTYQEGAELVRLAQVKKRILMVGHVLEYHPGILELRRLVDSGELGKVLYIYSNRVSMGKIRREENILWSFAPHDIAVILRLTCQSPIQVVACGGTYLSPNVADATVTNLLFDNGVRAHIFVSWLHPFKEQRLVVVGSKKMASFDDVSKKLVLYNQRVDWSNGLPTPVTHVGEQIPFSADEPLRNECMAFLAAVQSRRNPLTDGASALAVLKVLEAAQRSLMTNGHTVELPIPAYA